MSDLPVTNAIAAHKIYSALMQDIKIRMRATENLSNNLDKSNEKWPLDIELSYLQIRRIIENIVFSSMVKESDRYRRLRMEESGIKINDHGDAGKDWESERILKRLVLLSPYILPIPIKEPIVKDDGTLHFDRKMISVNHSRLIETYKKTGGYMHSMNPLKADYETSLAKRNLMYQNAHDDIKKELLFLKKLLWTHIAVTQEWTNQGDPRSPDQAAGAWIVRFGKENDNVIHMTLAVSKNKTQLD